MKRMKCLLMSAAILLAAGILPVLSQMDEEKTTQGIAHRGDPPYLLGSGWIPLLNGENMDGWEYVPNSGQGGWTATPAVIWDESDETAPLKGAYVSGDRIVNTIEAPKKVPSDIVSTRKFGDMEIYWYRANPIRGSMCMAFMRSRCSAAMERTQCLPPAFADPSMITISRSTGNTWVPLPRLCVRNVPQAIGSLFISIFRHHALTVWVIRSRMQNLSVYCIMGSLSRKTWKGKQ